VVNDGNAPSYGPYESPVLLLNEFTELVLPLGFEPRLCSNLELIHVISVLYYRYTMEANKAEWFDTVATDPPSDKSSHSVMSHLADIRYALNLFT
jgi:hypothetical protein